MSTVEVMQPTAPRRPWVLAVVVVACSAPLVAAAVGLTARGWVPVGEFAQAEMRLRDFWAHPPMLGAVARLRADGAVTSHPGPAAWWAMYPVYGLLGRGVAAFSAAVAAVALAWMAAALALLWRRGGDALAVAGGLATLLLVAGLGARAFTEPWNPWFAVMPFLCFLVAVWDCVGGHPWSLALAAGAGSFCVHAHLGYAPLVGLLSLLALGAVVWAAWRSGRRSPTGDPVPVGDPGPVDRRGRGARDLLGPVAGSVVVLVLMWAPPLWQQLTDDPGNLTLLARAWSEQAGRSDAFGALDALRLVGAHLQPTGPTLLTGAGDPTLRRPGAWTAALLLAWATAAAVTWRRRSRPGWTSAAGMHAVALAAVLAAWLTASRIVGEVFGYLVVWVGVVAAFVVLATAWSAWLALAEGRRRGRAPAMLVGAIGLLAVLAVPVTVRFASPPTPAGGLAEVAGDLVEDLEGSGGLSGPDSQWRHLVRWEDPLGFGGVGTAVLSELERRGWDVVADPAYAVEVGAHRVVGRPDAASDGSGGDGVGDPGDGDGVVWVVTGERIEDWAATPGAVELARADAASPRERAKRAALRDEVLDDLRAGGLADLAERFDGNYWAVRSDPRVGPGLRGEIDRLARLGLPTAVFLAPPGVVPGA